MALISRDHGTTLLQASRTDVQRALRHLDGHGGIDLEIEDEKGKKKVIVKHVENNPLHGGILTVTLQEVSAKDVVKLDVSVIAVNQRADEQGTVLTQPTTQVRLQGKMSDIPSNIEVDVSHLEVGHHVNAGDIVLPDGVKLLSSPDATLFSMQVLKAVSLEPELAEEPVEGEAPAEEPETEAGATEEDNG